MNINSQLFKEHSKENKDAIVDYLLDHPAEIDELMAIFFGGDIMLTQRAAWVVGTIGELEPKLIAPYFPEMISLMRKKDCTDAVMRNSLRVLQYQRVNEDLWGELYDLCINVLIDNKMPVAIKVFAMTTAYNIVEELPELKNELQIAIEELLPDGTPGIKSRGQKILNALSKL